MSELEKVIQAINKDCKYQLVNKGLRYLDVKKIPFSSLRMNYALYGGIPRGHITEFAGEENGGKTTLALDVVANAQRLFEKEYNDELERLRNSDKVSDKTRVQFLENAGCRKVVYLDAENTLDEAWMQTLGIDTEKMIILSPQQESAEVLFEYILQMLGTGEVGLLVIDSLGHLVSQQAFDKTIEERTYGGISMALTLFSKKASLLCSKFGTALIGINQLRDDLTSSYKTYTTTGGRGWKHACSVRLLISKGDFIDEDNGKIPKSRADNPAGNLVDVAVLKTKVFKPDRRRAMFTIKYDYGIDKIADIVELGLQTDVITQKGSYFYFYDENDKIMERDGQPLQFQGKAGLIEYLRIKTDFTDELAEHLIKSI